MTNILSGRQVAPCAVLGARFTLQTPPGTAAGAWVNLYKSHPPLESKVIEHLGIK